MLLRIRTQVDPPLVDYTGNFFHAAFMHGKLYFHETWNIPGACLVKFCRIAMQRPEYFYTFIALSLCFHFSFSKNSIYVITVSHIAHRAFRARETLQKFEYSVLGQMGAIVFEPSPPP